MNRIALLPAFILLLFLSCEKSDPCDGVQCQNGGVCVSGNCDCPPGFTGARCETEKAPATMIINTVTVKTFPAVNPSGAGWDVFDGPDLYLVIKDGPQVLYTSESFYENAAPGFGQFFIPQLSIFYPSRPLTFEVWDNDNDLTNDDFIGGIEGPIYRAGEKFPSTFTVQCSGCTVSFEVSVSYYF